MMLLLAQNVLWIFHKPKPGFIKNGLHVLLFVVLKAQHWGKRDVSNKARSPACYESGGCSRCIPLGASTWI